MLQMLHESRSPNLETLVFHTSYSLPQDDGDYLMTQRGSYDSQDMKNSKLELRSN